MRQGWERKKLKDIAEYSIGLTYSPKDVSNEGIIVLRSSNIQEGKIDLSDLVRVNKKVKENLLVKDGDILMCSRNGSKRLVGKTAMIHELSEVMTFGTFMTIIRSPYNQFLWWFFNSDYFREQIGGGENTMINQVTKYMLDDIEISLPPLSEQQHIVSILDEAFAAIAKAKANAEQNLKNAKELFESYLQRVFENTGDRWQEKRLVEVCDLFVDSAHRTPDYQDEGIPALRPRDVVNGVLNLSRSARVSQAEYEIQTKRHKPMLGDFVYSRELSYGWAAILPETPLVCLSQGMCLFRPSKEIDSSYLHYIINGPIGRLQAEKVAVGAAHPHINLGDIKAYRIPFSTLVAQKKVVQRLDALSAQTKKLETIYQQKTNDLEELKKSILQKAFSGELKTGKEVVV